jgi:hypothetical protein
MNNFVVLGKGPGAVRMRFHEGGIQLRVRTCVINGNDDMRRALRWVLDHPTPPAGALADAPATTEEICRLLTRLAAHGVSLRSWGQLWASWCLRLEEVGT